MTTEALDAGVFRRHLLPNPTERNRAETAGQLPASGCVRPGSRRLGSVAEINGQRRDRRSAPASSRTEGIVEALLLPALSPQRTCAPKGQRAGWTNVRQGPGGA